MSTNHLRLLQLQQLLKMPVMGVGTLLSTLNYCSSNVCESVLSDCSTCRFNFFLMCCQCSWFSTVYNILKSSGVRSGERGGNSIGLLFLSSALEVVIKVRTYM